MSKNNKKGQVTLLAVILGVLGLTLGLSVASRSLSDLKQASTVDFGTKALAAAEAAAEYGLNQISLGTVPNNCNTPTNLLSLFPSGSGIKTLNYAVCLSDDTFARSDGVILKDDAFQVDFTGSSFTGGLTVSWKAPAEAVQINALYSTGGVYSISRYAFRNDAATLTGSNFDSNTAKVNGGACDLTFTGAAFRSPTITVPAGSTLVLLRVTPIKGNSDILVCPTGASIPPQYYKVVATAETTNGTKKKVSVRRNVSGNLPGVFDNVLFSGGNITKN